MNIEEAVKIRAKMESDIENFMRFKIDDFQEATGLFVSDIEFNKIQTQAVGDKRKRLYIAGLKLTVEV